MKKIAKRFLTVLAAFCLALTAFTATGAFAENDAHVTVTPPAQTNIGLETGELYTLDLTTVFSDSDGHTLSYAILQTGLGQHVYITDDGTLVFSVADADEYTVTVRATCLQEEKYADLVLNFDVDLAEDGGVNQYGYNETAQSTVTVYVTLSNDGMPLKGSGNTLLANLKVELPYFDLNTYGLSYYYRYGTTGGSGPYTNNTVVARPTALHLYLYLLSHYFIGSNTLQSYSTLSTYNVNNKTVSYMDGGTAYTSTSLDKALFVSGIPTSFFMNNFWGHDCNLMYFRNHVYPLMSPGWGATADYILLSDNDVIDIALFSNWSFQADGAFLRFDGYDQRASKAVSIGQTLNVFVQRYNTDSVIMGGTEDFEDTNGEVEVALYDSTGDWVADFDLEGGNEYSLAFSSALVETGTYYVIARDENYKTDDACLAPAVMTVEVH